MAVHISDTNLNSAPVYRKTRIFQNFARKSDLASRGSYRP